MRLTLPTLICCCLFSLAVERGAAEHLNPSLRRRLRLWLSQSRRMDAGDVEAGATTDGDTSAVTPQSSVESLTRHKRSAMKLSGCVLFACSYHDLLHRLYQITNKPKEGNAPEKKMGSGGYGRRRRRSISPGSRATFQVNEHHL